MDAVEVVRKAVDAGHRWYSGTVADVTAEQASYKPEGVAHSIAALAAHTVQAEDWVVNQLLQGQPMLWDRTAGGQKLGIANVWNLGADQAASRSISYDPKVLQPYTEAVFANTQRYLGSLSAADLDRTIELKQLGSQTVADLLMFLMIDNTLAHTGEISAIKGIQGAKGYPF